MVWSFELDGGVGLQTVTAHAEGSPVTDIPYEPEIAKGYYGANAGNSGGYGMWSGALLAGLRANAPGAWSDNRLKQSQHFIGVAYTGICAICDGVSSATLEVEDLDQSNEINSHIKKAIHVERKGQRVSYDHELVQLLENPNPEDTWQDFIYEIALQLNLTGNCLIWMVPNRLGLPAEMYVIPTALAYPVPYSQAWPRGAWRLTPLYPYGPFAVLPTPVATAGAVVPADDVLHLKNKHPLLRWDGYSALTAGSTQFDIMEQIDQSRWAAFDAGINPSIVFEIDQMKAGTNWTQESLDRFQKKVEQKYANAKNFGRAMVLAPGVSVNPYSTAPINMAYAEGWEQMRDFILSLFGVPKGLVGITEATSYASLYASIKQFFLIKLQPFVNRLAAKLTKFLARRYAPSLRIILPLPALDDPALLESQLSADDKIGMRTVNERRQQRGLALWDDERGERIVGESEINGQDAEKEALAKAGSNDHPDSTETPVASRRDEADEKRPNNTDGLNSLPGMIGKSYTPPVWKNLRQYSSAMFNLEGDIATYISAMGLRISETDLAVKGRVHIPHIEIIRGL